TTDPPGPPAPPGHGERASSGTLAVIAGVGVLLLAMGVGVLIERAGSGSGKAVTPSVITVGAADTKAGASGAGKSAASVTSDWPAGTNGFTVQLQKLPTVGNTPAAVVAAKAAATAKGAKSVGALRSGDFSSLPAGSYVIYSGVYHTRAQAQQALG